MPNTHRPRAEWRPSYTKEPILKYLVVVLVVALVLVLSTFGVQNPTPVNIRFLAVQSGYVPISVIMLGATLSGMLLIALLGMPGRLRNRWEVRRLRHQLVDAEQQIAALSTRVPPSGMKLVSDDHGTARPPVVVPPRTSTHDASTRGVRPTQRDRQEVRDDDRSAAAR